jgi:hypothetical protein
MKELEREEKERVYTEGAEGTDVTEKREKDNAEAQS